MASTLLNEQGWNRDAIERQLAHGERDAVRAADNYAEHLPERRLMMQSWADYLDGSKEWGRCGFNKESWWSLWTLWPLVVQEARSELSFLRNLAIS